MYGPHGQNTPQTNTPIGLTPIGNGAGVQFDSLGTKNFKKMKTTVSKQKKKQRNLPKLLTITFKFKPTTIFKLEYISSELVLKLKLIFFYYSKVNFTLMQLKRYD